MTAQLTWHLLVKQSTSFAKEKVSAASSHNYVLSRKMLYTAVKQALKAFVHPVVGRLRTVVSSPLLSASRHVGVSDWCSVKNIDQEGKGRVRRVRFASNAKKEDGVLEWNGAWKPSSIPREVGDEVHYVAMPSTYGNFGDWFQHHQEDLEKRASFWELVRKKSVVENQWSDLEKKINSLEDSEGFMEERFMEKQRELEEVHPQLERKIDAIIYQEANAEELLEEEEINKFAEVEAARWEHKKIEKKLGGEGAVIEDAGGAEDMDVEMLDVQDQDHSEDNVEEDTHEVDNVIEQTVAQVCTSVEELKELTVHLEFSSFVQIGSKRRKLEANPEPQESDPDEVEVPFEESVQEEGEEEPDEVQEAEVQENHDSLHFEVENLGSGYTTDAAGRVRRFSHRLKGKSCRAYKF